MRRKGFPSPSGSPEWKEQSGVFLAVIDPGMRVLYISENCERFLGYTSAELTGRLSVEFLDHPDDVVALVNAHEDLLTFGVGEKTIPFRHKDGRRLTFSVQVIPVQDGGAVKELRLVCRQIPSRLKA